MKKIKLAKHQDGTKQEFNEGDFKNDECEDADEEENTHDKLLCNETPS